MQGNPKVIALLNKMLNVEQAAINVLWLQSHIVCEMGFGKLAEKLKWISRQKHHHLHQGVDRVIYLEGVVDLGTVTTAPMEPGLPI